MPQPHPLRSGCRFQYSHQDNVHKEYREYTVYTVLHFQRIIMTQAFGVGAVWQSYEGTRRAAAREEPLIVLQYYADLDGVNLEIARKGFEEA